MAANPSHAFGAESPPAPYLFHPSHAAESSDFATVAVLAPTLVPLSSCMDQGYLATADASNPNAVPVAVAMHPYVVPTTVPPQAQAAPTTTTATTVVTGTTTATATVAQGCPPLSLAISGEPDGPERVENLIKLSFTLGPAPDAAPLDALPWCSVVIPTGIFSSPKSVFIHDEDVDVLASMGRRFLVCRVQAVMDDPQTPGALVPVLACPKCVQREVKKLANQAAAASLRVAAKGLKDPLAQQQQQQIDSGTSAFQQQLTDAFGATMVVIHSDPEIALTRGALSFTLKIRLICYSSHHGKQPFRVLVTLWDSETRALVAQRATRPITVLDNHKNKSRKGAAAASIMSTAAPITITAPTGSTTTGFATPVPSSSNSSSSNSSPWQQQQQQQMQLQQLQQLQQPQQPLAVKRKRESVPMPSSDTPTPVLGAVAVTPNLAALQGSSLSSSNASSPHQYGSPGLAAPAPLGAPLPPGSAVRTFYKIIPASGTVGGGIPVTVLGQGFAPGDVLVFGGTPARDTRLWSDGTFLCTLPPAEHAGPVVVSVQGVPGACVQGEQLFTYTDDTDLRLFTHAFRLLGAVDAAGLSSSGSGSNNGLAGSGDDACVVDPHTLGAPRNVALRLVARAHALVGRAACDDDDVAACDEATLVRVLGPLAPRLAPVLGTPEPDTGRTLLHLAAMRGYARLAAVLLQHVPALLAVRDCTGCTALHHATRYSHAPCVALLLAHRCAAADAVDAARLVSDSAVARAYQAAGVAVPGTPCTSDGYSSDDTTPPAAVVPAHAPVAVAEDPLGVAQYVADIGGVMTAFDVVDVTAFPEGAGVCDSEPALFFGLPPPPPQQQQQQQHPQHVFYEDFDDSTAAVAAATDALPHIRDGCPDEPPRKLYVAGVPDSDGSGGGFSLRVQQSLMFGVALVVGALMVAVVAAKPHGFMRGSMPEHGARSSGDDQWLCKLSDKNTLVLRILSTICFGVGALLAVWFARQRTRTLQVHAGVLGLSGLVLCVYEIVAIFAID